MVIIDMNETSKFTLYNIWVFTLYTLDYNRALGLYNSGPLKGFGSSKKCYYLALALYNSGFGPVQQWTQSRALALSSVGPL